MHKNLCTNYISLEIIMMQFGSISEGEAAILFFQRSCDSSVLDSIAWNHTKFCMQYISSKDDIHIIFAGIA